MCLVSLMEILLLKIQLPHIKILVERMIFMKYKLKKSILFIIISIFIMTLLSACAGSYDKVTVDGEKRILFIMCIGPDGMDYNGRNTYLFADNMGNVYKCYPDKKLVEVIENKEVFECEIVGQVSADEVIEAYSDLCKIDEELFFYSTNEQELESDRFVSYYGVRYIEGEAEIMRLGGDHSYTENPYAEEIADFLETWDWREYLGL